MTHRKTLKSLTQFFGDGGNMPTSAQWRALLELPEEGPLAAVNFVKLRPQAVYASGENEPSRTGLEALMLYSEGSLPRVNAMGGSFLLQGLHQGAIIGASTDLDLVIVGNFPSAQAYVSLFFDPDYRAAFMHRRAAVESWKAVLSTGVVS